MLFSYGITHFFMKQFMHVLYTFLGSTMHTTVQGHQPDMEQTQESFIL